MCKDQQGLAIQLATSNGVDSSCFAPLAEFLISRSAFKEAQVFAQEALRRDPLTFKSWSRLASIYIEQGQFCEVSNGRV